MSSARSASPPCPSGPSSDQKRSAPTRSVRYLNRSGRHLKLRGPGRPSGGPDREPLSQPVSRLPTCITPSAGFPTCITPSAILKVRFHVAPRQPHWNHQHHKLARQCDNRRFSAVDSGYAVDRGVQGTPYPPHNPDPPHYPAAEPRKPPRYPHKHRQYGAFTPRCSEREPLPGGSGLSGGSGTPVDPVPQGHPNPPDNPNPPRWFCGRLHEYAELLLVGPSGRDGDPGRAADGAVTAIGARRSPS